MVNVCCIEFRYWRRTVRFSLLTIYYFNEVIESKNKTAHQVRDFLLEIYLKTEKNVRTAPLLLDLYIYPTLPLGFSLGILLI